MTLPNKCDSCRKLKIRCDEGRPRCGPCIQRRKDCTRTRKRSIRFVNNGPLSFERQQRQPPRETCASESRSTGSEESIGETPSPSTPTAAYASVNFLPLIGSTDAAAWPQDTSPEPYRPVLRDPQDEPPCSDKLQLASVVTTNNLSPSCQKISYYPESKEATLLSRWVSMLSMDCPMGHPLDAWGSLYSTDVAQRIGRDAALDICATTLLDNMHGYVNRRHFGIYPPAEISVNEAAKTVRNAIRVISQQQGCNGEILFAVHFLFITATFRGFKKGAHLIHHEASVSLLQQHRALIRTQDDEEMNQALFNDLLLGDITLALHYGRDSAFDSPTWLNLPPPQSKLPACPGYGEAWKTIQQTAIQIPRLARLVRQLRDASPSCPSISSTAAKATTLAAHLHTSSLYSYLGTLTALYLPGTDQPAVAKQPTVSPDLASHVPQSYVFSSARVLCLVLFHHVTRVLVAGLLQSLVAALPPQSCLFDVETVRDEDEAAAQGVAMCVEAARRTGVDGLRTGAALVVFPLHVAFGTWARLARRAGRTTPREDGRDRLRAATMKRLCLDVIAGIAPEWDCGVPSEEDLERKTTCYAGGPLMEEDPSLREARFCCHIGR